MDIGYVVSNLFFGLYDILSTILYLAFITVFLEETPSKFIVSIFLCFLILNIVIGLSFLIPAFISATVILFILFNVLIYDVDEHFNKIARYYLTLRSIILILILAVLSGY